MIPARSKKKKRVRLFVMNAKVLKKRKKPLTFSPFTREKGLKIVLILTVLATCGFGGFEVGRYFLSNPKYAVKHIVIRGNEKLSKEEIINLSLLEKGENIFRSRIYRAKERLSELPLIEQVSVSRFVPDAIVIEVVERRPRAMLSGRKKFLADYSGVLLPRSCCREPGKLPLIVGPDTSQLSVGDRCSQPGMTKAMRVLELCQFSPLSDMAEVDGIDSSNPDDIRLYFKRGDYTKRGCQVRIGDGDFEQKLAKLADLLESVVKKKGGRRIESVDLTLENVPVRF
ncbi:FtsQ-type POTRA domain-containing protein [bacterium]|nr:FtsQ-type POTRA domain-containing protein [bacterium]